MNHVISSAAVSFIEHCFIDDQGRFDVLCSFANVTFYSMWSWKESGMCVDSPVHIAGISTSFASFSPCFKYHMWMFLLKKESCAVTFSSVITFWYLNRFDTKSNESNLDYTLHINTNILNILPKIIRKLKISVPIVITYRKKNILCEKHLFYTICFL